jgi:type III secretory pathway lipoprotein EscJ
MQPGVDELLGKSFLPSPKDDKILREHAMAGELARTIGELDGVDRARVHLTLADRSVLSPDPDAETKVVVLARRSAGASPNEAAIQGVVAAAVPGIETDSIRVFFSGPEEAVHKTVFIGPIEVVSSSAAKTKMWLGGLLGLCCLLALSLIGAGLKLRRVRLNR